MAATYPGHPLREVVLGTKDEVTEGTFVQPDADYGTYLHAADFRSEFESFKNQPLKPGLTPSATTLGGELMRFTWEAELHGKGSTGTPTTDDPQWAKNTPGMQSRQAEQWDISADTFATTPIPGEKFTNGANGIVFVKFLGTAGSATQVIGVEIGTVAISTEYTGEVSGATFTTSGTLNKANYGRLHTPDSSPTSKSIGLVYVETGGDWSQIAGKGGRGTWGISCTRGQTVRLPCETLTVFDRTNTKPRTAEAITRDTRETLGFTGANFFEAFKASGDPNVIFSSLNVSLGNPMAARENTNNAAGFESILHGPGGREPSGDFDPELAYEAATQELWSSKTSEGILEFALGSSAGDIVEVYIGRAKITGYDGQDRGPVKALALPFDVAGAGTTEDYEIMILTR